MVESSMANFVLSDCIFLRANLTNLPSLNFNLPIYSEPRDEG